MKLTHPIPSILNPIAQTLYVTSQIIIRAHYGIKAPSYVFLCLSVVSPVTKKKGVIYPFLYCRAFHAKPE